MYTAEELKDINYALVSVELKGSGNMDQRGYLLGLQPIVGEDYDVVKSDNVFVWLFRRGAVHMFHIDYYYISQIDVGFSKETSGMILYKNTEDSQKEARQAIKEIIDALKLKQMVRISGLIDHQKYTKIPESVKSAIEASGKATTAISDYTRAGNANYKAGASENVRPAPLYGCGGHTTDYHKNYTPYVPKEVTTISFKRTTKYDIVMAIADMANKILEIKENIYKAPKLKHIPADDVVEEEKTSSNVTVADYDDMDNITGY